MKRRPSKSGPNRRLFPYFTQRGWFMIPRPYNSWTTRDLEMCRRRVVAGDPAVPVELPWKLELLQSYWYEWGRYYYETPTTSFFGPGQLLGQFAEVEQGDRRFVACIYPYNLSKSRNI